MTLTPGADIIGTMMSLNTHVALTYLRSPDEPQRPVTQRNERDVAEQGLSAGELRRRLAQMHLAPATGAPSS